MQQSIEPPAVPLFTRRQLAALLFPLVLEQLLGFTIGLADTVMVAGVGEAAVSGVSLVDTFNALMLNILSALPTGGAVVVSQYIGRRDKTNARHASAQVISVMLGLSLFLSAFVFVFRHAILRLTFGSIDPAVMSNAETYFMISALGYPIIGLYSTGTALFRSLGNSRLGLATSLVMNLLNLCGNYLLIVVFRMGVLGAALSSLCARAVACLFILLFLQQRSCPLRVSHLADLRPRRDMVGRILAVGVPTGIESGMFQFGKLLVSSLVSTLGTSAIAANAVTNMVTGVLNIPGSAIGLTMITVIGQCLGAGEKKQAIHYGRSLLLAAYLGMGATNLLCLLFGRYLLYPFHLSPEAMAMGLEVLRWFNIFSIACWPLSFTLPNLLRAAGDTRFPMFVSVFSMWAFRVVLCYLLTGALGFGLMGIWFGMFIDWVFRSVCFLYRFKSGRWMQRKVI